MAASDILRNNVKDKLARGEVVASMTVRLSRSIEIAMEQRIAAIKLGGWSEFGVGSAPGRRMRTLIQVNARRRQINEASLPCGKL